MSIAPVLILGNPAGAVLKGGYVVTVSVFDGQHNAGLVAHVPPPGGFTVTHPFLLKDKLVQRHFLRPATETENAGQVCGHVLLCDMGVALTVTQNTLRVDRLQQLFDLNVGECHSS